MRSAWTWGWIRFDYSMSESELKERLKGADAKTLKLVHDARLRDLTILREFIDAGVSKVPTVDAYARMQTEVWRMNQGEKEVEVEGSATSAATPPSASKRDAHSPGS